MSKSAKKKYESPRQLERQANILKATREMLADVGYHATTMRGLAERAGVVPGTLYNLYKSKDELVLTAVEDLLIEIGQRAIGESDEGLSRILRMTEITAATIVQNPEYAEAMARALFGSEKDDPLTDVLYARSLPATRQSLGYALEQGDMRPDADLDALATHMVAQGWGVVMAWIMGLIPLADVQREYCRSFIMTLMAGATEPARVRLQETLNAL